MAKIDGFNKQNISTFHRAVSDAIKKVADEYGVKIEKDRALYYTNDPTRSKITLEFKTTGAKTEKAEASSRKMKWDLHAARFGFKDTDFEREFEIKGGRAPGRYKITEINPHKPKNAITLLNLDSQKTFVAPADLVLRHLNK